MYSLRTPAYVISEMGTKRNMVCEAMKQWKQMELLLGIGSVTLEVTGSRTMQTILLHNFFIKENCLQIWKHGTNIIKEEQKLQTDKETENECTAALNELKLGEVSQAHCKLLKELRKTAPDGLSNCKAVKLMAEELADNN